MNWCFMRTVLNKISTCSMSSAMFVNVLTFFDKEDFFGVYFDCHFLGFGLIIFSSSQHAALARNELFLTEYCQLFMKFRMSSDLVVFLH